MGKRCATTHQYPNPQNRRVGYIKGVGMGERLTKRSFVGVASGQRTKSRSRRAQVLEIAKNCDVFVPPNVPKFTLKSLKKSHIHLSFSIRLLMTFGFVLLIGRKCAKTVVNCRKSMCPSWSPKRPSSSGVPVPLNVSCLIATRSKTCWQEKQDVTPMYQVLAIRGRS